MRAGMLKELVEAAKSQLVACWEELHIGEEERSSLISSHILLFIDTKQCFLNFLQLITEDTLTKLESEVERMTELLEISRPVLKLVEKREEIKTQKKELEQASSDPNRLLSKSGRDAGRLLREEKMRKAIEKDLPKIEEKLRVVLVEWEEKNSKPFMYNGSSYLELMEDESRLEKQKKEDEKMRKEREKLLKKDEAKTPNKLSQTSTIAILHF